MVLCGIEGTWKISEDQERTIEAVYENEKFKFLFNESGTEAKFLIPENHTGVIKIREPVIAFKDYQKVTVNNPEILDAYGLDKIEEENLNDKSRNDYLLQPA